MLPVCCPAGAAAAARKLGPAPGFMLLVCEPTGDWTGGDGAGIDGAAGLAPKMELAAVARPPAPPAIVPNRARVERVAGSKQAVS